MSSSRLAISTYYDSKAYSILSLNAFGVLSVGNLTLRLSQYVFNDPFRIIFETLVLS